MDVEQEGDSISTSASKDVDVNLVVQDNTMEPSLDKEVLGLDPSEGATTTDDNEESEIAITSGGTASIKSGKKRKRNRRRKKKSRPTSDNENISGVTSNERLTASSQEKPVVVTTYVCSSSELDKVRKLIDDNGNDVSSHSSAPEKNQSKIEETDENHCKNEAQDDNESVEMVYQLPPLDTYDDDLSKIDDSGIEELSENLDHELQMDEETEGILKSADFCNRSKTLDDFEMFTTSGEPESSSKSTLDNAVIRKPEVQALFSSEKDSFLASLLEEPAGSPLELNFDLPNTNLDLTVSCDSQASSISRKSNASQNSKAPHKSYQKSKKTGSSVASSMGDADYKETVMSDASQKSGVSQKSIESQSNKSHNSKMPDTSQKSDASQKSTTSHNSIASKKSAASHNSIASKKSAASHSSIASQKSAASSKCNATQKSEVLHHSMASQNSVPSHHSIASQKSAASHNSIASQKSVTSPTSKASKNSDLNNPYNDEVAEYLKSKSQKSIESNISRNSKASIKTGEEEHSEKSTSSKRSSKKSRQMLLQDEQAKLSPVLKNGDKLEPDSHSTSQHSIKSKASQRSRGSANSKASKHGISNKTNEEDEIETEDEVEDIEDQSVRSMPCHENIELVEDPLISDANNEPNSLFQVQDLKLQYPEMVEITTEATDISEKSNSKKSSNKSRSEKGSERSSKSKKPSSKDATSNNYSDQSGTAKTPLEIVTTECLDNSDKSNSIKSSRKSRSERSSEKSSKSHKSISSNEVLTNHNSDKSKIKETPMEPVVSEFPNQDGHETVVKTSPSDLQRSELVVLDALGVLNANDFPSLELPESNDFTDSSSAHETDDPCLIDVATNAPSNISIKSNDSHKSTNSDRDSSKISIRKFEIGTMGGEVYHYEVVQDDESQHSKTSRKSCSSISAGSRKSKKSVRIEDDIDDRQSLPTDLIPPVSDHESQSSQSLSKASNKSGGSKNSHRSNLSQKSASSGKSSVEIFPEEPILEDAVEDDSSHHSKKFECSKSSVTLRDQIGNEDLQFVVKDNSQKSDKSTSSKSASIKQDMSELKGTLSYSQTIIEDKKDDDKLELPELSEHSEQSGSTKSLNSKKSSSSVIPANLPTEEENLFENDQSSKASDYKSHKSSKSNSLSSTKVQQNFGEDPEPEKFEKNLSEASRSSKKSKSSKSTSSQKSQWLEKMEAINSGESLGHFSVDFSVPSASSGSCFETKSSRKSDSSLKSSSSSGKEEITSDRSRKSENSFKTVNSQKSGNSDGNDEQRLSVEFKTSDTSLKSQSSSKSAKSWRNQGDFGRPQKFNPAPTHTSSIFEAEIPTQETNDGSPILASKINKPDATDTCDNEATDEDDDSQSTKLSEKTAVIYDEEDPTAIYCLHNIPDEFLPVNLETSSKREVTPLLLPDETIIDTEDEVEEIRENPVKPDETYESAFQFISRFCDKQEEKDLNLVRQENSLMSASRSITTETDSNQPSASLEISSENDLADAVQPVGSILPDLRKTATNFFKASAFYCPATLDASFSHALRADLETSEDDKKSSNIQIQDDLSETSVYSFNEPSNHSSASKISKHSDISKASNHSGTSKKSKKSGASKSSNHSSASKVSKNSKRSTDSGISKSCRIIGFEDQNTKPTVQLLEDEIICENVDATSIPAQEIKGSESSIMTTNISDHLNKSSIDLIFKTNTISGNPSCFFSERTTEVEDPPNSEISKSESQRDHESERNEEVEPTQIQPSMDNSWLAGPDNEGRDPSIPELESREIKLIKTDDCVLNDSMLNNNYLQIHDPREEIEAIANQMQTSWYERRESTQLEFDDQRNQPLAETELYFPSEPTETSSHTLQLPHVPFPSIDNYQDDALNPPSPHLHPSSLARIALIKRQNPELAAFAQNAVRDVISQAQEKVFSVENDFLNLNTGNVVESEYSNLQMEDDEAKMAESGPLYGQQVNPLEMEEDMMENYQDSEPDPCTTSTYGYENPEDPYELQGIDQAPMRLVLSSNKATAVNLSASSSNTSIDSSTDALLRLPQVPNPSVANADGLQNSSTPINLANFSRWVGDICSTKEMQDAFCDGKQNLELEPKEMLDKKSVSGAHSVSNSVNFSETYDFPDVPDDEIDLEDVEPIEADVSDQESEIVKRKPNEEKMLKELFRDDSSIMQDLGATSIPQPPHWVIDPKVIEDAVTESDLTEEPEKTSFIQSIFNCFGKKHRSKKSKEDYNAYMAQNQPSKTSGRGTSKFRSFSLPKRKK